MTTAAPGWRTGSVRRGTLCETPCRDGWLVSEMRYAAEASLRTGNVQPGRMKWQV